MTKVWLTATAGALALFAFGHLGPAPHEAAGRPKLLGNPVPDFNLPLFTKSGVLVCERADQTRYATLVMLLEHPEAEARVRASPCRTLADEGLPVTVVSQPTSVTLPIMVVKLGARSGEETPSVAVLGSQLRN